MLTIWCVYVVFCVERYVGLGTIRVREYMVSLLIQRGGFVSHNYCFNHECITLLLHVFLCAGTGNGRLRLKCDGTRAETRFRLSAKRTNPFKSAGASVQSTTGSRGVRISGSNAGYTMFRGSVKGTGYPLHSSVSPSLPLSCVTACHHISTGLYLAQGIVTPFPC